MTPIAPHITAFLQQRLAVDRRASPHTCDTYAYAFQLLFQFMSQALGVAPAELALEHLDAPRVLQFLDHLQQDRHNTPRTRNARLAAIRSFMRFVEYRVPAALDQVQRVRAISAQRTDTRIVRHLSGEESRALLDAPEPTTRLGIRDRAILLLALAGGLRVSELVGLRLDAVQFTGRYVDVRVRGKGRRERALTLWKSVGNTIRAWLAVRGDAPAPELFLNAWDQPMTRSGFERVLRQACRRGRRAVPVAPGQAGLTARTAAHLRAHYAAGDARPADIYLQADPTEKLEALAAMTPPALRPGKFRPPDRLIAALRPSTVMRSSDAVNP